MLEFGKIFELTGYRRRDTNIDEIEHRTPEALRIGDIGHIGTLATPRSPIRKPMKKW
jgi:hypothetical protein